MAEPINTPVIEKPVTIFTSDGEGENVDFRPI